MGKIEFEANQKHMGSPIVVAYDEVSESFANTSSILLPRIRFKDKKYPKHIRVTVEWIEEKE